ncbi:MAG TPA: hypothetical protein VF648_07030 [Pyrinomonadaceae bacterium]|jgi:hypothetical protein
MPLINCPDCQKEVSDIAPNCLNCGRPIAGSIGINNETVNHSRDFTPISVAPHQSHAKPPSTAKALLIVGAILVGVFVVLPFFTWYMNRGNVTANNNSNSAPYVASLPYSTTTQAAATPTPSLADSVADTSEAAIRANVAEVDKSITYEHLKKNADRYSGKAWMFKGKILQVFEQNGQTGARVSLDDWGNKPVWVACNCTTDFVENDRVFVVGYLTGTYSYTSQANWEITIPALAARAILSSKDSVKYQAEKKGK